MSEKPPPPPSERREERRRPSFTVRFTCEVTFRGVGGNEHIRSKRRGTGPGR